MGSSPSIGSCSLTKCKDYFFGEILKRPTRTDCKSVGFYLRRFESCSPHIKVWGYPKHINCVKIVAGVAQLVERQPSKLNVAGSNPVSRSFSSRCSSGVERFLGKEEVTGSNPVIGSGLMNLRRAEKLK